MDTIRLEKEFTVDLSKFRDFHPLVQRDAYDSAKDEDIYGFKTMTVTLKLNVFERKFDKYFDKILNLDKIEPNGTDRQTLLNEQKNELFYIFSLIKRSGTKQRPFKTNRNPGKKLFSDYIQMLEVAEQISNDKSYDFKLTIDGGDTPNTILTLPKTNLPKDFYNEIISAIYRHHLTGATLHSSFGRFLRLRKGAKTLSGYKEELDSWAKSKPGRKQKIKTSYEAMLLHRHIRMFPQFPPSGRANAVLAEKQGSFIQRFLNLFGILDNSFEIIINEDKLIDDILYNKNLRSDLKQNKNLLHF
jgi:hypothetical protein